MFILYFLYHIPDVKLVHVPLVYGEPELSHVVTVVRREDHESVV